MSNCYKRESIVVFGAGMVARNIIGLLPYGEISYVVDNDAKKWGRLIKGIEIFNPERLYKDKDKKVVLTFKDKDVDMLLQKKNISFYYCFGQEKNYFLSEEFSKYQDAELYSDYLLDFDLKRKARLVSIEEHWRTSFISELNEKLVMAMKNNASNINDILGLMYSGTEKYFDENYYARPGMRLVRNIIIGKGLNKICDLACGHGDLLVQLRNDGLDVCGLDFSKDRVELMRENKLNVIEGSVEEKSFSDSSFDAVVCMECMEHIASPGKLVSNIYEILKPGGYVFITVPYMDNCDCDEHVRYFNIDQLYSYFAKDFMIENIIRVPYLNYEQDNNLFLVAQKR